MDEMILNELTSIKWLLILISGFLGFLCLLIVMFFSVAQTRYKRQIENNKKTNFLIDAERLENIGDHESLLQLAESRYAEYPHDPEALWYAAIAHYKASNWSPALSAFKQLQQLDPAWRKYTVADYIDEIHSNFSGPSSAPNT